MDLQSLIQKQASQCVKCGICIPHCPTYQLAEQEFESPRGRIAILDALAKEQIPCTPTAESHIDHCLSCRKCESVCPSGVTYGALFDQGKALIVSQRKPSFRQSLYHWLLNTYTSSRGFRHCLAYGLWAAKRLGFRGLVAKTPLLRWLKLDVIESIAPEPHRPRVWQDRYPSPSEEKGIVALHLGCVADTFEQPIIDSAIRLLNAAGYSVEIPPSQGCCGALHQHAGYLEGAKGLTVKNLEAFGHPRYEAIISCVSGCGAHLKEYSVSTCQSDLQQQANEVSTKVMDIATFLAKVEWPEHFRFKPYEGIVWVHDPCSLKNVLKTDASVYALLNSAFQHEFEPLPLNDVCCGAAGTHMLKYPKLTEQLITPKIKKLIEASKGQSNITLLTSNVGCQLSFIRSLKQAGMAAEVMHPVVFMARQMSVTAPRGC